LLTGNWIFVLRHETCSRLKSAVLKQRQT